MCINILKVHKCYSAHFKDKYNNHYYYDITKNAFLLYTTLIERVDWVGHEVIANNILLILDLFVAAHNDSDPDFDIFKFECELLKFLGVDFYSLAKSNGSSSMRLPVKDEIYNIWSKLNGGGELDFDLILEYIGKFSNGLGKFSNGLKLAQNSKLDNEEDDWTTDAIKFNNKRNEKKAKGKKKRKRARYNRNTKKTGNQIAKPKSQVSVDKPDTNTDKLESQNDNGQNKDELDSLVPHTPNVWGDANTIDLLFSSSPVENTKDDIDDVDDIKVLGVNSSLDMNSDNEKDEKREQEYQTESHVSDTLCEESIEEVITDEIVHDASENVEPAVDALASVSSAPEVEEVNQEKSVEEEPLPSTIVSPIKQTSPELVRQVEKKFDTQNPDRDLLILYASYQIDELRSFCYQGLDDCHENPRLQSVYNYYLGLVFLKEENYHAAYKFFVSALECNPSHYQAGQHAEYAYSILCENNYGVDYDVNNQLSYGMYR